MSLDAPTEEEAEALVRLQMHPEFKVLQRMIGEDLEKQNIRLISGDNSSRDEHILIGQLRFGTRLTDAVASSTHTLQKHRTPKT